MSATRRVVIVGAGVNGLVCVIRLADAGFQVTVLEQSVAPGGGVSSRQDTLPGFVHAGGHDADHVFAAGLEPVGAAEVLERGRLSDHAPVAVTLSSN